jgi:hypothetical protein
MEYQVESPTKARQVQEKMLLEKRCLDNDVDNCSFRGASEVQRGRLKPPELPLGTRGKGRTHH